MSIDDRVAAGAAWLDANRPGWWQRINLDTLDLGDDCNCILGQEHGEFWLTPEINPDLSRYEVDDLMGPLGLIIPLWSDEDHDYRALTAAWRTLIQARRDAPAVWPGRTHDGQRMRDTDTADVDRGVL